MAQVSMVSGSGKPRVRQNIRTLQNEYDKGNKKPLSDLLRAWSYIQTKLKPTDPNSFFMIAGYHGEPFRGAGFGNPQWWGGYCNHGNVLFPTWHRAYLWRLENALRSVKGCEDVTLPYWDETEELSLKEGIPAVFLQKTMELDDGSSINNPIYSYTFQMPVWDNLSFPQLSGSTTFVNPNYYKDEGYETKRFPFSGLDAEPESAATNAYNAEITNKFTPQQINEILNERIQSWLFPTKAHPSAVGEVGILAKYKRCLEAPNYTVFSNTTSALHYNEITFNAQRYGYEDKSQETSTHAFVALESPHNDMHLAVGGFNIAGQSVNDSLFTQANGDMGENETASFDPIFYFHHCFVDRVFWEWQKKWNHQDSFDIIDGYPGTNSVDSQGPTPGVAGGTWLNMNSPLAPFTKELNGNPVEGPGLTSKDVINIEKQLGYTYYEDPRAPLFRALPELKSEPFTHLAHVGGINRGNLGGSFIIATYKEDDDGNEQLIGYESFLSRWHTSGCANCQTHLNAKALIPLHGVGKDELNKIKTKVIPRLNQHSKTKIGNNAVPSVEQRIVPLVPES